MCDCVEKKKNSDCVEKKNIECVNEVMPRLRGYALIYSKSSFPTKNKKPLEVLRNQERNSLPYKD